MAYPASVTTFTTKSNGGTIDASHVNDLQTEVNAIEDGLINGLSHDLIPTTNSTRDIGSVTKRWRSGYFSSLSVNAIASSLVEIEGALRLHSTNSTNYWSLASDTASDLVFTPVSGEDVHLSGASLELDDSESLTLGTGKDATVLFNATDLVIDYDALNAGTTDFRIQENGTNMFVILTGGEASLTGGLVVGTSGKTLRVNSGEAGGTPSGDFILENASATNLTIASTDANSAIINLYSPSSQAFIRYNFSTFAVASDVDVLSFGTVNTEAMRITSGQLVGINCDGGAGGDDPQSLLDVRGDAGAPGILTLSTKETTVIDGDVLGRINFQAPLEADGGDSILVSASIWAEADATFSATVNQTDMVFALGSSEAAVERMRLEHTGSLTVGTTLYVDNGSTFVGVGVDTPLEALHVRTAGASDQNLHLSAAATGTIATRNNANSAYTGMLIDGLTLGLNTLSTGDVNIGGVLVSIGDTANTNMTIGLTINQGASADQIIAYKGALSTGLTTAVIGVDVETDDFYIAEQTTAGNGGLYEKILAESTEAFPGMCEVYGGAPATTDTSGSLSSMNWFVAQHDGANGLTDMAANSNAFSWGEISSAPARLTRMLLKADDGELHLGNTTLVALDDHDDISLIRAMQFEQSGGQGMSPTPWNTEDYGVPPFPHQALMDVGVLGEKDDEGFCLMRVQPTFALCLGGIWQNHVKVETLKRDLQAQINELQDRLRLLEA